MKIIYSKETRTAERVDGDPCIVKVMHTDSFIMIEIDEPEPEKVFVNITESIDRRTAQILNIPIDAKRSGGRLRAKVAILGSNFKNLTGIASGKTGPLFDDGGLDPDKAVRRNPDGTRCLRGGVKNHSIHRRFTDAIRDKAMEFGTLGDAAIHLGIARNTLSKIINTNAGAFLRCNKKTKDAVMEEFAKIQKEKENESR